MTFVIIKLYNAGLRAHVKNIKLLEYTNKKGLYIRALFHPILLSLSKTEVFVVCENVLLSYKLHLVDHSSG